jgi:glycerol-3-phosphate acyltransferase PlsY
VGDHNPTGTYDGAVSFDVVGLLLAGAAYLAGSFPTASIVGMISGHDHSKEGSGNPGASNVYRTSGAAYGIATVVIDALKGFLPVLVTLLVVDRPWAAVAWVAVTIGHVFPLGRFRHGGKGVATGGGGSLPLFPIYGLALLIVFAVVVRLTKTASIGSLAIAVLTPVGIGFLFEHVVELYASIAVSLLVIARHRGNIARLARGRELPLS